MEFCGVSAGFIAVLIADHYDHGRRAGGRCAPRNFAPFTMIFGGICHLKYLTIPPFLPLSGQKRAPGYPGYQEKFFES